jgi:hypothetical protein
MFETKISQHSARSRLKKACGDFTTSQIYNNAKLNYADHLHLIPSILSPQTSYPLAGMCRSNPLHRLPNWSTRIALRCKLRLPLFNETPPNCKCGIQHDPWGDHMFNCKKINKKFAHNIIRDTWAEALQPALATAGYIRNTTKIDIERKHIKTRDITAQPFDISFDPDPSISDTTHIQCPYLTIGADITITNSNVMSPTLNSLDDVSSVTAFADAHLQRFEKRKLNRINKKDANDNNTTISGDQVIGDLLHQNMILLPFAIDPFGRWGPILQNFLLRSETNLEYKFHATRPNAKIMFHKATSDPCPLGILRTADHVWKHTKQRNFFGYSYAAPTPSTFTIQQLGLGITKAFTTHIRNAIKHSTPHQHTGETTIHTHNTTTPPYLNRT